MCRRTQATCKLVTHAKVFRRKRGYADTQKQDWLDIAEHYGIKQIPVAIEEMAELTQVLTKYLRISQGGQFVLKLMFEVQDSIEEELSDVIVMMIQLQYLFNIDNDTINKIADEKLKRTLKLMEEQK